MIHRFLFFVFLTAIIFPPSISHSQSGNTHYWPETGASISLPDGWRVLVHDGYELYMTTIPDIDEFPEDPADYEPGQLVAQFEQVRFGSSVPLDADLEQALDVYAGRTFGVLPQNVELFEIEGREVALLQQIVSVEEARLGVVLAMVAPERPAGLYRLIAIGHHPSDDPAPYVELARQWTAEAFFPEGNLLPPGEPASAGDLALIVPDGFTLLEFDDGVILTNMDTAIESLQEDMALDDGDILIRIVSMQGEDERPTAEAYAGESNSSFSYRVSTTNISGIFLSTEDAIREIHVPRRPAWSNTPFTLLDVNAVGYSDAELRTLLRPIIAGMTLGWLPDTSQTISIGDYQLGIPAHWEPTTLDRFPEMIFFEESRVFDAAFEEANPGDVIYGFMPDAVSALNLDTAGDNLQQQAIEAFMPNFGTEQAYSTRTIEIDGVEILVADISALEDRSGPSKYFGQIYVLPSNDNDTLPMLALNYEARIDYTTEIQPFAHSLLTQIIAERSALTSVVPEDSPPPANTPSGKPYDEWAIAGIRDLEEELTPLVAEQFLDEYFDREEARENDRRPSLIENLTLAPDGETLFIGVLNSLEDRETRNSFCIHKLDTDIIQCNALPELATFDRSRQLLWSPDSRYLVFHQDFWRTQINSDIYLLDTETLEVANLTPDADPKARLIDPNRESDEPREDIFFDGAPFWSADSQTLYFVRHVEADPANGSWENIIQQIDMATRDMQEVMELGSEILWLSVGFHNQIALSPDGTQVVMTTPAPNKQDRFIRIANLETGDIRRLAAFDDLLLPVEAEREAIIDWIDWLDDGRGLIAQVSNGLIAPTPAQVVRIDPGSGDIMWLFNVSSETPEEEFVVTVMGSPRWSTLTTDGETIFYISQRLGLFTAPASLDSEPYLLGEPENLSPPRHDSFLGSVTSNGRLLSRMMLIEFE